MSFPGMFIPVQTDSRGVVVSGFATPSEDRIVQVQGILPRRVLPIIFLPGIMGSNLRLTQARQVRLNRRNNLSWRPDRFSAAKEMIFRNAAERQSILDQAETEVDTYDPTINPTGDKNETSYQRNSAVITGPLFIVGDEKLKNPLLTDDFPGTPNGKTRHQKALERGWGEIFYKSYQEVLETCEL